MSDASELPQLVASKIASRVFDKDTSVFAPPGDPEVHARILNRLGWLDAPAAMAAHVPEVEAVASATGFDGLTHVYLLGMGGSSLCAEVLRDARVAHDARIKLEVLDTTDEYRVRKVTEALTASQSLFLVASKSGSTIEVTSLERHFWSVMTAAGIEHVGRHFIAITDPGTSLVKHAQERGYRHTFVNPPDIGGRYSALSLFGLVPAGLLGMDLNNLLTSGRQVVERCRLNEATNPGLALGTFMGAEALKGRDKLTLLVPRSLTPLGPWIEQLVAESTGKQGRGVLPIVGEPIGKASDYGHDRAFVAVLTSDGETRSAALRLEQAGYPVFRIETSPSELGGEFFRWEFATAIAGSILKVNPFDEPDVRKAKEFTQKQLDARRSSGVFRIDPPFVKGPGYSRREFRPEGSGHRGGAERYFALLDYLPAEPRRAEVVEWLRRALRQRSNVATTHGIGPRYLHSTGQYHKGGPNSGIFLLLTAADASATPVPGTDYTFSTLKQAQALGDFDALKEAGREVIHYHLEDPTADFSAELEKVALALK